MKICFVFIPLIAINDKAIQSDLSEVLLLRLMSPLTSIADLMQCLFMQRSPPSSHTTHALEAEEGMRLIGFTVSSRALVCAAVVSV